VGVDIKEKGQASIGLTLGVVGAVLGVAAGIVVMFVGGAGLLIAPEGGGAVLGLGAVTVVLAIAGGVGAMLTSKYPEVATFVMAITGVGGFVSATVFWIVPGVLLIAGGVFAWTSRPDYQAARPR